MRNDSWYNEEENELQSNPFYPYYEGDNKFKNSTFDNSWYENKNDLKSNPFSPYYEEDNELKDNPFSPYYEDNNEFKSRNSEKHSKRNPSPNSWYE